MATPEELEAEARHLELAAETERDPRRRAHVLEMAKERRDRAARLKEENHE